MKAGAGDLRECSIQLLARCAPEKALPFGCQIQDAIKSIGGWNIRDPLANALNTRAELSLNECAHLLPINELVSRLRKGQFSWQTRMTEHEGLKTAEGRFTALEQALAPGREIGLASGLVHYVMPLAVKDNHEGLETLLITVWNNDTHRFQGEAGQALLSLMTPTALAALDATIDKFLTNKSLPPPPAPGQMILNGSQRFIRLILEATFLLYPKKEVDRFSVLFTPANQFSEYGRYCLQNILSEIIRRKQASSPLDDRWPDTIVKLFDDYSLQYFARLALSAWPKKEIADVLQRNGLSFQQKAPKPPVTPRQLNWKARYLSGDFVNVWKDMQSAGDVASDPTLLAEAEAVSVETMNRVRTNFEELYVFLKRVGVEMPARSKVLGKPSANIATQLTKLQKVAGPISVSLRVFYEIVGWVDFTPQNIPSGPVTTTAASLAQMPPIVISTISAATSGLTRAKQENKNVQAPLRWPLGLPISPTPFAKALFPQDIAPLQTLVPELGADCRVISKAPGPIVDEYFVDYLRHILTRPGYPALCEPF